MRTGASVSRFKAQQLTIAAVLDWGSVGNVDVDWSELSQRLML